MAGAANGSGLAVILAMVVRLVSAAYSATGGMTTDEADTTANCGSEDTITVVPRPTVNSASAP
jgi:hypothetical protein